MTTSLRRLYAFITCMSRANLSTPFLPMTTASHKDLLLATLQEFDTAQQRVDRTRSEMHCIISSLPSSVAATSSRPILIKPQSEIVELKPSPKLASKPLVKRMSPPEKKGKVQEALLYHVENPHLTQEQVAVQHGLEPKALSRPYAKKLKKAIPSNRDKTPKDEADDFLYNGKWRKN